MQIMQLCCTFISYDSTITFPLCVFQMEEQKKKSVRSDNWIQANIVVKVVTKRLGEKYYKKKAVIRVTEDSCHPHWVIRCLLQWYCEHVCDYYRKCRVNTQLWWRWSTLETNSNWTRVIWRRSFQLLVLPVTSFTQNEGEILKLIYRFVSGKRVLIVNGQYKDTEAILEGINEHKFSATLALDSVSSLWKLSLHTIKMLALIHCTLWNQRVIFVAFSQFLLAFKSSGLVRN